MMGKRWQATLTIAIVVIGLAGCGGVVGPGSGPEADSGEHVMKQAREALARWDAAVAAAGGNGVPFVPVGEVTGQLGDWEAEVGDNNKRALGAGKVAAGPAIPEAAPPEGEIRWADGTTRRIAVVAAAQAVRDIVAEGARDACGDCNALELTAATLVTAQISTSRGPATVPVWHFQIKDTRVLVTRVAVDPGESIKVVPPPWDPYNAPGGVRIESAEVSADSNSLTVTFTGAPDGKDKPCGADYTAETLESTNAVVVIVHTHAHGLNEICTAIGASRTAVADLDNPLGDRAVLEVVEGTPVPVRWSSS